MHTIEDMLVEKNYSRCPLKKRPVNYHFDENTTTKDKKLREGEVKKEINCSTTEEPENLSLKKHSASSDGECNIAGSSEELINVSDCCEDEGVDVDHMDDDEELDDIDEDDEIIDCVDIEEESSTANMTTQAAALAAAAAASAAAAAAAASVVVPTPTYPKYGLQPWQAAIHMSPYTAEFYRTINNPHLAQQISPLHGDLLSPNSPTDSIGSLSPPPHYLHGRASSVSPPMRSEVIHRPIGVRQMPQQSPQHHRFMPYPLRAFAPHHPSLPAYPLVGYPLQHHAPISPAYSEQSSYHSVRPLTPESNCSSVPEDLSLKNTSLQKASTHPHPKRSIAEKRDGSNNSATPTLLTSSSKSLSSASSVASLSSASSNTATPPTTPTTKKDKHAPPRYQCPDCQKSYSTFSGLTKHQQFHCPAAEGNQVKKSFSCKDCDKTYVSLGALKMHIRTHTLPCKCNICGKAFSRPWLLQGHIRTHTGEKPFSCQHCHRAFADRSNLRAHLQTHSDIKKYSCTSCSKTFSRMSLLTKHSEGGCPGGNASAGSSSPAHGKGSSSELGSSYAPLYAEH